MKIRRFPCKMKPIFAFIVMPFGKKQLHLSKFDKREISNFSNLREINRFFKDLISFHSIAVLKKLLMPLKWKFNGKISSQVLHSSDIIYYYTINQRGLSTHLLNNFWLETGFNTLNPKLPA